MRKILIAGATGYLGSHIARALSDTSFAVRVIARSPDRLSKTDIPAADVVQAQLTQPDTLKGCCDGIDTVISTVGITRQKDGLTYLDVDYQANVNLLREAQRSGVRKFIYVSLLNGKKLRHLKMCDAKEKFVETLEASDLEHCVVRPNGFFSDMAEFYSMAAQGRVYVFGTGEQRINPIDGADLAEICIDAIDDTAIEVEAGGPETLSYNQIADLAFDVAGHTPKITHIPDWMRKTALGLVRVFTRSTFYGPVEFFMTVTAMDMVAPERGNLRLEDHFHALKTRGPQH